MSAPVDRPNVRLVRTLARKQLDQVLDLLDSLDADQGLAPGDTIDVTNANQTYHLYLRITRLGRQHTLPFPEPDRAPERPVHRKRPAQLAPNGQPVPLKRVHKKLLEKASPTDPEPAKVIIKAAGYKENSYSLAAVTYLARHRLLLRTPDGYIRAS